MAASGIFRLSSVRSDMPLLTEIHKIRSNSNYKYSAPNGASTERCSRFALSAGRDARAPPTGCPRSSCQLFLKRFLQS
jgi:hypothetical protein